MTNKTTLLATMCCLALALAPMLARAADMAVVAGVDDYPGTANDLHGCVNDARLMSDLLQRCGFQVTTLLDRQVTPENFLHAASAAAGASAGGRLFLCYSGHGTQVPDQNADEKDGLDEAFVMWNASGNDVQFLIDDDVDRAVAAMTQPQVVFLLFDSCFSGGNTKQFVYNGRHGRQYYDGSKPLNLTHRSRSDADPVVFNADEMTNPRVVAFTACRADQLAQEDNVQGQTHGIFSYCFAEALTTQAATTDANGDGRITIDEVYQAVLRKVSALTGGEQTPAITVGQGFRNYQIFDVSSEGSVAPGGVGGHGQNGAQHGGDIDGMLSEYVASMEAAGRTAAPKYDLSVNLSSTSLAPGEYVDCKIRTDADCYVYIVDVYYGGDCTIIFPNFNNRDNHIQGGRTYMIPDLTGGLDLQVQPSSKGGIEYLMVITSAVPIDLDAALPSHLSADRPFGNIESKYGTRGALAELNQQVWDGSKPLQLHRKSDEATGGSIDQRSRTVKFVRYSVR